LEPGENSQGNLLRKSTWSCPLSLQHEFICFPSFMEKQIHKAHLPGDSAGAKQKPLNPEVLPSTSH
jgi:hypothetical protein